jgi:N-acetyl sugar amidotransferase
MKYCSRCLLPETHETIQFDDEGVCNICRNNEFKKEKIDWGQKKEDFLNIIEEYRGKYSYDCIVPYSGGKDSTYTLYMLAKEFKLKCLVVSFDHGFYRQTLLDNNKRVFKKLGVDSIIYKPNWLTVRKLMLESLLRKGDFCWHCHSGIFAYPMQVAINNNIPLVIWGEPQAEYTAYYSYEDTLNESEEVDEKRFNRFVNLGITADDMLGMLGDSSLDKRDLDPFKYPKLRDLKRINYRSICLGSYIPWDVKKQVALIKKELNWEEDLNAGIPPEYGYEKIECQMQGIRDYLKYIKRGYGRTTHLTTIDVRNNRIEREEGQKLIDEYDGKRPESLDHFLEMMGLTEEEFNTIALQHTVPPHRTDFKEIETGPMLPDRPTWDNTARLDREYTIKKMKELIQESR